LSFWSALAFAALLIVFTVAYLIMIASSLATPWIGTATYQSTFQVIEFVPQMIGFVMLPVLLLLVVSLHVQAERGKRLWSVLSVVSCAAFVATVLVLYFIQVGHVLPSLLRGATDGLDVLVFANPHSLTFALNYFAWGFFLGTSLLCLAVVFSGSRLALWIRWLLVGNSAAHLLLVVGYVMDSLVLQLGAVASWLVGLPVVMLLIAAHLKRSRELDRTEVEASGPEHISTP
jgi:hypothetical protein